MKTRRVIRYKNLWLRALNELLPSQLKCILGDLRFDLNKETDPYEKRILQNQIDLVEKVFNERAPQYKCEKCGEPTSFTMNLCEECFDDAVDAHYSDDSDE